MGRILNFKHWHLFLLIVLTGAWTSPSPTKEIINSISIITALIWIYSIGFYGQAKVTELGLPELNLKHFKFNIILIPVLIVLIYIISPGDDASQKFDLKTIILIPLGLYLTYAVFQTVIFASKTLVMIEQKKTVTLNDYFITLILIGMLVVGVWIIQPKINRLIGQNNK
jgi:hypothetical protein